MRTGDKPAQLSMFNLSSYLKSNDQAVIHSNNKLT